MISFAIFTHSGMEQSSMPKYRLRAEFKMTASRLGPFSLPVRISLEIRAFSSGVPPTRSCNVQRRIPSASGVRS